MRGVLCGTVIVIAAALCTTTLGQSGSIFDFGDDPPPDSVAPSPPAPQRRDADRNQAVERVRAQRAAATEEHKAQDRQQYEAELRQTLPEIDRLISSGNPPLPGPNEIFVFVFENFDLGQGVRAMAQDQRVFVSKDAWVQTEDALPLAHEIGHALGHTSHSPHDGDLMDGYGGPAGYRIRKYQADIVNAKRSGGQQ